MQVAATSLGLVSGPGSAAWVASSARHSQLSCPSPGLDSQPFQTGIGLDSIWSLSLSLVLKGSVPHPARAQTHKHSLITHLTRPCYPGTPQTGTRDRSPNYCPLCTVPILLVFGQPLLSTTFQLITIPRLSKRRPRQLLSWTRVLLISHVLVTVPGPSQSIFGSDPSLPRASSSLVDL